MKKDLLILIIFVIKIILAVNVFAEDGNIVKIELPPCPQNIPGSNYCPPTVNSKDIADFIRRIYIFALSTGGILAVGSIVIGAIYYIINSGAPDRQKQGKSMITSAIWGLVLLFSSYLILQTINPRLVQLKTPGGEKLVTPTSLTLVQQPPPNDCGDFINIKAISSDTTVLSGGPGGNLEASLIVPGSANANGIGAASCVVRKVVTKHGINIDPGQYYNEEEFIDAGSVVWLYPYFIKGTDPKTTARCLIYARKEGDDAPINLVDLQPTLELCSAKSQKSGISCLKWQMVTTAYQEQGFKGSYRTIELAKTVDKNFNFEDITISPSYEETVKIIKENNISACYPNSEFPYCKPPVWTCIEYKYENTIAYGTKQNPDEETKRIAGELLTYIENGTIGIYGDGTASCQRGTDPYSILTEVANGNFPRVCFNNCDKTSNCPIGGPNGTTTLSKPLLYGLKFAAQKVKEGTIPPFTITSLTGGSHAVNSYHYKGRAADIIVRGNAEDWQKVLVFMKGLSETIGNDTKCEYFDYNDKLYRTDTCSEIFGNNKKGQHIHITFKE